MLRKLSLLSILFCGFLAGCCQAKGEQVFAACNHFRAEFYFSTFSTPTSFHPRRGFCSFKVVSAFWWCNFKCIRLASPLWPFLLNTFFELTLQTKCDCMRLDALAWQKERHEQELYLHKLLACRERRVLMTLRFIFTFCLLFLLLFLHNAML